MAPTLDRMDAWQDRTQAVRPVRPQHLLEWLPTLGNVLYVHDDGSCAAALRAVEGMVCDRASLPLLQCCWLMHVCQIGKDGPHEWCQGLDGEGRVRARLHLLPETDFLAWDRMVDTASQSRLPCSLRVACPFRPSRARVVHFGWSSVGGVKLLEQRPPVTPHSAFSLGVARRFACSEALRLS